MGIIVENQIFYAVNEYFRRALKGKDANEGTAKVKRLSWLCKFSKKKMIAVSWENSLGGAAIKGQKCHKTRLQNL